MPNSKKVIPNLVTAAVTLLAVLVGGARLRQEFSSEGTKGSTRPRIIADYGTYGKEGHRIGRADAPVTIVEFADFQCPYCRSAWVDLKGILSRSSADVALVYRHFPLASHPFALSAARASECAALFGRFEQYHDRLFEQADSIGTKLWMQFAREAGISDSARFNACVSDSSAVAAVEKDQRAAARLGVDGTPTLLINNVLVPGYPGKQRLGELITDAIKGSSKSRE